VIELFTSQGCSDCPPADTLLTELAATRPDVLPLAFHVTYWNSLGWTDPFSFQGATDRQKSYRAISSQGGIYTPQAVIDGSVDAIGSDRPTILKGLRDAAASAVSVLVSLSRQQDGLVITVDAGSGTGDVWLVGYDAEHRTHVGRGENSGATLLESNIVRSLEKIGDWRGGSLTLHHAMPAGEHAAVILQAPGGRILGAARLADPAG
jgi:hypothetical protein